MPIATTVQNQTPYLLQKLNLSVRRLVERVVGRKVHAGRQPERIRIEHWIIGVKDLIYSRNLSIRISTSVVTGPAWFGGDVLPCGVLLIVWYTVLGHLVLVRVLILVMRTLVLARLRALSDRLVVGIGFGFKNR